MLNDILWQAEELVTLTVSGEGSKEFEITARPVIFSYYFGVTPGLLLMEDGRIGWWYSGNVTDIINAWRVVSLMSRLKRIRESHGYDQTLCCLVISLRGDNHEERRKNLGTDFDLSPEAMTELIEQTKQTGPNPEEMEIILERLGDKLYIPPGYDGHLKCVEASEEAGRVHFTPRALELVNTARIRRQSYEHQMEADETELQEPVEPINSFAQLAADLAMSNFMDHDIDWGWGEIKLEELDDRIRRNSIGRWAYSERGTRLNVSEKAYSDPSAHYSSTTTDGSITFLSSNFGQISPPFVEVGDQRLIFHRARYHRGGMFWVFTTIQPLSVETKADDESQAMWIQVPEIRWTIGSLLGLESVELPVGLSLAPMVESAPAAIKAKRRFGRG